MMASQNEKGKYTKDIAATRKIQNTEFLKIIRGIAESKLYGYTGLEFLVNPEAERGGLQVNYVERRNILADQRKIVQRQGIWMPQWSFDDPKYSDHYVLINSGELGLFSAVAPLILAKNSLLPIMSIFLTHTVSLLFMAKLSLKTLLTANEWRMILRVRLKIR